MGPDDEKAVIYCDGCGRTTFQVDGYGPAGINEYGKCSECGHEVSEDDAYWADMRSQIDDPAT